MSSIDAVSIFAEGTFEEQVNQDTMQSISLIFTSVSTQIRELVNYLAQGRSDEEKASFTQPFEDALATAEGQKPFEEDEERRREVFEKVVPEVKGLGQGSERGTSSP